MAKLNPTPGDYGYGQNMPIPPPNGSGLNGPVEQRSCTDLFCCILFILNVVAFFAIAGYSFYYGSPAKVLGFYSYEGIMCGKDSAANYPCMFIGEYLDAYMPYLLNTSNANMTYVACVDACPANGTNLNCTGWTDLCPATPSIPATYPSVSVGGVFCVPDPSSVQNATQVSAADITQSMTDTQSAYLVLIGAVVAAFILGIVYVVFLRCCAGVVIWLSILSFILGMIAVGVYMFLYTQGIEIVKSPFDLSTANQQSLQIASYVLWSVAAISVVLVIVLYKRIKLGNGFSYRSHCSH